MFNLSMGILMSQSITAQANVTPPSIRTWPVTVFLFFLGWVFMYADRTILNPVQTAIRSEFGLNNAEVGLISSVFFFTYTFMQIPTGMLGDKFGKAKLIAFGFAIFGLFTGITGLAGTFGILLLARAMTGIGEGFYYGPQYALSSETIPARFRTIGTAVINSGQAFGITLGLMASSYISYDLNMGWKVPFYVFAIPTILVGIAILLFVKEPKPEESQVAAVPRAGGVEEKGFKALFKNRNLVLTYLLVFCSLYGFFVMVTWLPVYLEEARGIAKSNTGFVASLVAWTSIPAALLYGYISDKIGKRRPVVLCLLPMAAFSIVLLVTTNNYTLMLVALVCYGFFGKLATDPLCVALVADNAPRTSLSTAFGIFNFVGMSSAILAPYITGWLRDATGSFNSGFYLSVVFLAIGWIGTFMIREKGKGK